MLRPLLGLLLLAALGCDGGFAPPDTTPGAIRGVVRYEPASAWPPQDSLFDLRFVAMRFVPQDTSDFLQLAELVFNDPRLKYFVDRDTFLIRDVRPGRYVYNGVAQRYSASLFSWRPVGLYTGNGGVIDVPPGDTAFVEVTVDFRNPPPFPPR